MKTIGVVAEYNPFHYGHAHIFSRAREQSDLVIAVMSGNFVQRGDAAVIDKYARAEAILSAGADLVVELPYPWSTSSAEYFASAGVRIASCLGANQLWFGAAETDIHMHLQIADFLLSNDFDTCIKMEQQKSSSVAVIRENLLVEKFGECVQLLLNSPNDILAIEYCKAVNQQGLELCLHPVQRVSGTDYGGFLGAGTIRDMLSAGVSAIEKHMPDSSYTVLLREFQEGRCVLPGALRERLFEVFRLMPQKLSNMSAECGGGVLERLVQAAAATNNGEEMFSAAATKRYTNARLRRAALFATTDIMSQHLCELPAFTVLLGASKSGRDYLSSIKKSMGISLVTKPADGFMLGASAGEQYRRAADADGVYTALMQNVQSRDFYLKKKPIVTG